MCKNYPIKNVIVFIGICKKLRDFSPRLKITTIGRTPERENLEKLEKSLVKYIKTNISIYFGL